MSNLVVSSECRFANSDDLMVGLAARIWDVLEEAIERDNKASMVLSGGSTPVGLYNVLRELPLPWPGLHLCLSDERWVNVDDEASNEAMLMRELVNDAGSLNLLSMARRGDTPQEDAQRVEGELQARDTPWDLVLLGMGSDGHTASLFPGADGLAEALTGQRRCVAIEPGPNVHSRLTLTKRELLNSRRIILLLRGAEKWRVYRTAVAGKDVDAMPVRAILHQQKVPVDVYWSLD